MGAIFGKLARHRRTLRQFPRLRDRAFYIYGRLLRRLAIPLPCRHSNVKVRLRGQRDPFHVRLSSTDWLVLEEIFQKDEYTAVQDLIKDASWIVDLGANAGYSLRYWQTLFPRARILALEPEPNNCRVCLRNIAAARLESQVTLLQAAVGSRRGQMHLMDTGHGEWGFRTADDAFGTGQLVEVVPLLEVLETYASGQTIDLLKCDIEGAEKDIFEDCSSWIRRVAAIIVELHPPYSLNQLLASLKRANADFQVSAQINRKLCPIVLLRRPGKLCHL